jgi:tRNA A37 methylthiotransferase MiaB
MGSELLRKSSLTVSWIHEGCDNLCSFCFVKGERLFVSF